MFKKVSFNGGYFYVAEQCSKLKELTEWALHTATAKMEHTIDSWQQRKSKFAKFVDIYYGDLAKNIVRAFIEEKDATIRIVEYDRVRDDKFLYHDKYDLMIGNEKIEIKSSLEKKLTEPEALFNSRRIIINIKNMHQSISDYVVQVFYVPHNISHYKEIEEQNNHNVQENLQYLCKKEVEYSLESTAIYIAGWVDKETQIKAIDNSRNQNNNFGVSNYSTNAGFRQYANILINTTQRMDDLIRVFKKQ